MNKTDIIKAISKKTGSTLKDAERHLGATLDCIVEALKTGDKVVFFFFFTFEVISRAARQGRNPQTSEVIQIPASKAPVFKAGKSLKDAINA
jgi:DNA-binding protein HU-beta